jgi:geranylgeranyl reductase family protein
MGNNSLAEEEKEVIKNYDVIIVGAGPGGLECANVLTKSNKSVLLLEKNSTIGQKVCAGGLTTKSMDFLRLPGNFGGRKFQKTVFETKYNKIIFDYGSTYIHVIDREELGKWQEKRIEGTPIEIQTNASVTKIEGNYVTINETRRATFSFLVGADGSNSIVRKFLGIKTEKVMVACQYKIEKNFPDLVVRRDSKFFGAGYAWIFPQGNFTSVGFACFPKVTDLKKARENFETWLKKQSLDFSADEFQANPINYDFRGYKFGNIFLLGDAAGLASPFTGEGIYQALISGNNIARIIIDSQFRPDGILKILRERRKHLRMLWLLVIVGPLIVRPFRMFIFKLLSLIVKNRYLSKYILKLML